MAQVRMIIRRLRSDLDRAEADLAEIGFDLDEQEKGNPG